MAQAIARKNRIHYSAGDRALNTVVVALLLLILVVVAYPLIYVVSSSFSSTSAVISGRVWLLPVEPSLAGYNAVFSYPSIMTGYANSIFYTVVGTLFNLFMSVLAAYPLSRSDLKARNHVMMFFAFTMFFSGGLIPGYLLVRDLGLLNTRASMILPGALSVYNVIVMRTFFQSNIPRELLESSQLDGCTDFRFVASIVLPLSTAIIAVMALFYAVGHWNAYFNAFLYLMDKRKFPLQLILREILVMQQIDITMLAGATMEEIAKREGLKNLLKYSLIVVASAPVMVMYPFVQKYFVKGVMIGAIKG